jgi:hypothetical protein
MILSNTNENNPLDSGFGEMVIGDWLVVIPVVVVRAVVVVRTVVVVTTS